MYGQGIAGNLTYLTSTLLAFWLAVFDKERRVDKQRIREMKHAAGIRYFDFTPVLIVAPASVIGAPYLAIGTGDTDLYVLAGMLAAAVISIWVFLFRGAVKANEQTGGRSVLNEQRAPRARPTLTLSLTPRGLGPCSTPSTNAGISSPQSRPERTFNVQIMRTVSNPLALIKARQVSQPPSSRRFSVDA